jgi:hypothetical protein
MKMKTLYVTLTEWLDVLDAVRKNLGSFGGFQSDYEATVSAIGEVFGPDVEAQCVRAGGGVKVEIVTELAQHARFVTDENLAPCCARVADDPRGLFPGLLCELNVGHRGDHRAGSDHWPRK